MKSKLANTIGQKIKLLRENLGISQEEFSDRAGIHVTNLSKLENGVRLPKIETLLKICEALDVSVAQILPAYKKQNSDAVTEEILLLLSNQSLDEKRIMLRILKAYCRQKS